MEKVYVAIDVGCHECGVGSEVIGSFKTKGGADDACDKRADETKEWRDGGQAIPEVFEIILPTT
jgi:hypothetical protein